VAVEAMAFDEMGNRGQGSGLQQGAESTTYRPLSVPGGDDGISKWGVQASKESILEWTGGPVALGCADGVARGAHKIKPHGKGDVL
jgi:hypothetical protein